MTHSGQDVALHACRYIGVSYAHKGRSRHGLDCIGLVIVTGKDLGLLPTDLEEEDYGSPPDPAHLRFVMTRFLQPGSADTVGDVLLFRFVREPQHLAIRTEYGLVHCYARVGRVVHTTFDPTWRRRLVAAYRFHGIV